MVMSWEACEKRYVRLTQRDVGKIESILEKVGDRIDIIESLDVNVKTVSFIVEGYCEAIKELLVAYMLKDGLRSRNHQCMVSYFFLKNPEMKFQSILIENMSDFRNGLNYYGRGVPLGFYEENVDEFKKIINFLFELLEVKDE
ncbi:MAG: hypothetical protein KJ592_03310 [Nanoarchaeota archaeon]|nr:hypothetical protein [Nanoarchaeota archaeon]